MEKSFTVISCKGITLHENGRRYQILARGKSGEHISERMRIRGIGYQRYANLRDTAWRTILNLESDVLPIKTKEVAQVRNYSLLGYNRNKEEILALIGDECFSEYANLDAFSFMETNDMGQAIRKAICYNEKFAVVRKRYSIAHECGHLDLVHVADKLINYEFFETEADLYAARLLMPACIAKECNVCCAAEMAALFQTSIPAAVRRYDRLQELIVRNKFYRSPIERAVRNKFSEFIRSYNAYPDVLLTLPYCRLTKSQVKDFTPEEIYKMKMQYKKIME